MLYISAWMHGAFWYLDLIQFGDRQVKNLFCFKATRIRADYSAHVLRSMFQGFKPLSLAGFVAVAAPAYLLSGIGTNPIVEG